MTVKYHVVGAQTSTGVELKYSFNSKDIALRYANFYSGNTLFPRKPEHVGSVLVKGDTFEEQLTALIEDGGLPFLRPTTSWALSPFSQRIGRVTRKPAFAVDISKLLEGLNLPSADELVKILTGSGDSSGTRIEPLRVTIEDSLEAKALERMLNEDSAERISLEEMIKRYSFGADPATPFSDETPEVKCGCMLCAISDGMELEMKRQREAADTPKADTADANGQQYSPEDPAFRANPSPEAEGPAESGTVGNPNQDLEDAYKMGFRAAASAFNITLSERELFLMGAFRDQQRSDLKELKSFDRNF